MPGRCSKRVTPRPAAGRAAELRLALRAEARAQPRILPDRLVDFSREDRVALAVRMAVIVEVASLALLLEGEDVEPARDASTAAEGLDRLLEQREVVDLGEAAREASLLGAHRA